MFLERRFEEALPVFVAAFGELHWHNDTTAMALYGGQELWLRRVFTRANKEHSFALGVRVGRPFAVGVYTRHNTSGVGPVLLSGDPAFDTAYLLTGRPPEVVVAAFDAEQRARTLALWPNAQPNLSVREGEWLELVSHLPSSSEVRFGQAQALTVEGLQAKAYWLQRLGARLTASFDASSAHIAHTQGPAGVAAWQASLAQQAHDEQSKRRALRLVIVLLILFVVAIVSIPILGAVVVLLLAAPR